MNELKLDFALTSHIVPNLAIRVSDGKHTVCYSGDGNFTEKSEAMYNGTDLLLHEGFLLKKRLSRHGTIHEVIRMAEKRKVKCLAITHIQRNLRISRMDIILAEAKRSAVQVLVPEAFDEHDP